MICFFGTKFVKTNMKGKTYVVLEKFRNTKQNANGSNYMSFERARRVESNGEKIFVRTHTGAEI